MDMMLCQNCGTPLGEGFRVCPTCGDPVPGADKKRTGDSTITVSRSGGNPMGGLKIPGMALAAIGLVMIVMGINNGLAVFIVGIAGILLGIGKRKITCPMCGSEISFINSAAISKDAHCNACHADIKLNWT